MSESTGKLTGSKRVLNDTLVTMLKFFDEYRMEYGSAYRSLENLCKDKISFDRCCNIFLSKFCHFTKIINNVDDLVKSIQSLSKLNQGLESVFPDRSWTYQHFCEACECLLVYWKRKINDWEACLKALKLTQGRIDAVESLLICMCHKTEDTVDSHLIRQIYYEAKL